MKEFDVTITEKLQAVVTVQAETAQEAEQMVNDQWRSGDHVLDADNFIDVEFEVSKERELAQEKAQSDKTLDVLLVEPGQYPRMVTISGELESLQRAEQFVVIPQRAHVLEGVDVPADGVVIADLTAEILYLYQI